jgi:hypothetical protein
MKKGSDEKYGLWKLWVCCMFGMVRICFVCLLSVLCLVFNFLYFVLFSHVVGWCWWGLGLTAECGILLLLLGCVGGVMY